MPFTHLTNSQRKTPGNLHRFEMLLKDVSSQDFNKEAIN